VSPGAWSRIKEILAGHKGRLPVVFDLESGGVVLRCAASSGQCVEASERLALELEELLGPGTVRFGMKPNGSEERRAPGRRRRRPA
jgi:hypothetical protein